MVFVAFRQISSKQPTSDKAANVCSHKATIHKSLFQLSNSKFIWYRFNYIFNCRLFFVSVCNRGLGVESGLSLPSGFSLTASSGSGTASNGRLSGASSWCASSIDNNQYLQLDFGKIKTITGIAIQGNPTENKWVKEFYMDYGTSSSSLMTYQENGIPKVSILNRQLTYMAIFSKL